MSCSKMLVLCGETYAQRLWCAWELFVLFSFLPADPAVVQERVEVVSFGPGEPAQALLSFDVAQARCYDPNEERRLRSVIEPLGADYFNERVRQLAGGCAPRMSRSPNSPLSRITKEVARLTRESWHRSTR